jgi:hypothetical protein
MATRSSISIKTPEGKYRGIYCHNDGYLSYNGRVLKEHYTDVDKINRLIDLGDISSLGERVEPIGEHSFDKSERGTTVAYGRDRRERNVVFKVVEELKSIPDNYDSEYDYVWDDGWKILKNGKLREFEPNEKEVED